MTDAEYEKLKAAASAEYWDNIRAIERVRKLSGENVTKPPRPKIVEQEAADKPAKSADTDISRNGARPRRKSGFARGGLMQAVKNAIAALPAKFSTWEAHSKVEVDLGAEVRAGAVKNVLLRLEKQGYIETVTRGKGRKPSTYRLIVEK